MVLNPVIQNVSQVGIIQAIYWASKKLRYSIDRPGMKRRTLEEALDDKIMGDIASIAVLEYLRSIGVNVVAYDEIRTDNFRLPDPGWDIAIGLKINEWAKSTNNPQNPVGFTTVSIKSSRLPREDTLAKAISSRDFKIFKKSRSIDCDIATDLELQVYYPYLSTQLGNLTITPDDVDVIKNQSKLQPGDCMVISNKLQISNRWGRCAIVGYNDKQSMINDSNTLSNNYWTSFGKDMWIAPLRKGKEMSTITQYDV